MQDWWVGRCVEIGNLTKRIVTICGILRLNDFITVIVMKPILFYLLIILFDGSGDINFSYCFVFTFVFRLFFLLLRLLRNASTLLHRRASRWMQAPSIIALSATRKAFFV